MELLILAMIRKFNQYDIPLDLQFLMDILLVLKNNIMIHILLMQMEILNHTPDLKVVYMGNQGEARGVVLE